MMKLRNFHESKKGVASLYAVIFATILFGVITLSFIRIILSEARQSGDDELSQSAYDSALAGVEDTKRAVNKYYACLNNGGTKDSCGDLFNGTSTCNDFNSGDSKLKKLMGFQDTEGEVKIQEQSTSMGKSGETSTDQAYTCITLSDIVEDYRSTLSSDTRVRVVPLGVESSQIDEAKVVEFQWFSENNGTNVVSSGNPYRLYENRALKTQGSASKVPVISLTLLYTGDKFQVGSFNNSTSQNYSTMILLPGISGDGITNSISWDAISKAGDSDAVNKHGNTDGKTTRNEPFLIQCKNDEFACSVDLKVDNKLPDNGNAFLIVSMPYGETISDFKVAMYKDETKQNPILFEGAQISVDSTGRANQLYRRVETRLDPVDSYFPYPQFAAELDGDDDSKLWKNFWITYRCWTQSGECPNNGTLSE